MFKTRTFLVTLSRTTKSGNISIDQIPYCVHPNMPPQVSLTLTDVKHLFKVANNRRGIPAETSWVVKNIIPLQEENSEKD